MQKLITKQWPFWLGGLFVGLAEIVFYYHYDMFIVVTTGLAQMFAVTEQKVLGIDWVARGIVAWMMREMRAVARDCLTAHRAGVADTA